MTASRTVILGGGFGGAAAALGLRRRLGERHRITLVDRAPASHLGGANPAIAGGFGGDVTRSITGLRSRGVEVLTAQVRRVDLETRAVVSDAGTHRYDHLVIALGVAYDWDAVPGSATAHTFYTTPGAWRLRDRLAALEGGRVVIGIGGVPYRCPPAPIEGAMHIDAALRRRGIRDQVTIDLVIPEPAPLGVAGPEASARVRHALAERGIALRTERTVTGVDGHRARCSDGSHLDGDLIVTVPVHRVPDVVASSGLTAGQAWVPVDATTMETDWSNVFAVGDVNSIPVGTVAVPKAGVFASGQGVHVAATIASRVLGTTPPDPYDGTGFCLFEFGPDRVAEVGGTFLAAEGPEVGLSEPSSDLSGKETWVADWEAFRI